MKVTCSCKKIWKLKKDEWDREIDNHAIKHDLTFSKKPDLGLAIGRPI